jgi:acyl-CoA synthetase (AMP-forming)/AMP-acid ligase II
MWGRCGLLRAVIVGDTLVVQSGKYDPAEVSIIERHKINRWTAVPTMVSRLLDHPDLTQGVEQPEVDQHRRARTAGSCNGCARRFERQPAFDGMVD